MTHTMRYDDCTSTVKLVKRNRYSRAHEMRVSDGHKKIENEVSEKCQTKLVRMCVCVTRALSDLYVTVHCEFV